MSPTGAPGCAPRADRSARRLRPHRRMPAGRASRAVVWRREQLPPVVSQLADGFLDVGERLVLALFREPTEHAGSPASRELLERAHVEIAVMKEFLERGHVPREEAAVLADAVPAHRR